MCFFLFFSFFGKINFRLLQRLLWLYVCKILDWLVLRKNIISSIITRLMDKLCNAQLRFMNDTLKTRKICNNYSDIMDSCNLHD